MKTEKEINMVYEKLDTPYNIHKNFGIHTAEQSIAFDDGKKIALRWVLGKVTDEDLIMPELVTNAEKEAHLKRCFDEVEGLLKN